MIQKYDRKIIISGKYIEIYQYSKPIIIDKKIIKKLSKNIKLEKCQDKSEYALRRAKNSIRRLINSNVELKKFATLTFKKNETSLDLANYEFNKFIKRLKSERENIKYLSIPEFQKRGAVHYHMLCDLNYIKNSELAEIWKNGFVKINEIKLVSNIGAYVSKYLTKTHFDVRFAHKRRFFCSRNLIYPQVIHNLKVVESLVKLYNIENRKPIYENIYDTKWRGEIQYKQFRIND